MAGPRIQQFRARGVQSEAKTSLNAIYLAQLSYQDANDQYFNLEDGKCAESEECGEGFPFAAPRAGRYEYEIKGDTESQSGWAATAYSKTKLLNGCVDQWRINAQKFLCAISDAANKKAQCGGDGADTETSDGCSDSKADVSFSEEHDLAQ